MIREMYSTCAAQIWGSSGFTRAGVMICIVCAGIAMSSPALAGQRPMLNSFGAPVLSSDGERIEYSRIEMDAQRMTFDVMPQAEPVPPAAKVTANALSYTPDWKYFAYGTGVGDSNIDVSRVDGIPEIVVGGGGYGFGGNRYWFLLKHNADTGEYDQVFVSPVLEGSESIRRLKAGQFVPGGSPEIVVGISTGRIELWNQQNRSRITSFETGVSLKGLDVADVDADGAAEIIISSENELYVYTLDGVLDWDLPGVGGSDVIAAQMDADAAMEIATSDGYVVDAGSQAVQWTWPDGFGFDLEAGDIDGDGFDELIAAEAWGYVWSFDVDQELPKWSIAIFNTGAIGLDDVDEDGVLELIVGEAQWGDQLGYDTVTQELEWQIGNPEHGTTAVHSADVDGDGRKEIIWGAGHSSTGPDHLYIGDWSTDTHEWSNVHLDGPFRGAVKGDVDGDGAPELVTVSNESDSGYGAGRILVFDGFNRRLRAISQEVAGGLGWSGTHEVKLRNIDADPANEIVVSTSTTYDGTIEIYDYDGDSTFTEVWEIASPLPDGAFRSSEVMDVDGDGESEVVGGADDFVYVYDLETGLQEWNSLYIAPFVSKVAVANTDEDASLEILALGSDGDLYIFDGTTKTLDAIISGDGVSLRTLATQTVPHLVLIGGGDGNLTYYRYVAGSYTPLSVWPLATTPVDGFTVGPRGLLAAGSGGRLTLYWRWGTTPLWSSEPYGSVFGTHPAFFFGTNGLSVVAAGSYGLVSFSAE